MSDYSTIVSTASSCLALTISGITAWLTLFRPGKLKMTRPTTVYFGPDVSGRDNDGEHPKVFLRTLLYSTSKRPKIIENMFIKVRNSDGSRHFNIWVYGETNALARGSGLRISDEGIVCNHHFLLPKSGPGFDFTSGDYTVEVYATLANKQKGLLLSTIKVSVTEEEAVAMRSSEAGLYFDWEPDTELYRSHLNSKPFKAMLDVFPALERIAERRILGR